jgi:hypothetical protein
MAEVKLPHGGWMPRAHQEKLWRYLEGGGKRAIAVWHRRAGKDEICLHHCAVQAWQRPGNYWHCLPEYAQARKAIWTAVNAHTGRRRIDESFPPAIRESLNDQEMFIRLRNGSTFQMIGSDRYNQTVGSGIAGITYSEFALAHPAAWAFHRPIVEENNGYACFISTPRGRNHLLDMFGFAQRTRGWFAELLTVEHTHALSPEQLELALAEYQTLYGEDVGSAQFRQEYYCDFAAAILGAFYALEMMAVRAEGRITEIEHDPLQRVHTAWDIGIDDDTSIWWFQVRGSQVFVLDHYQASNMGLDHYAEILEKREKERGWRTGACYVPHDAKVREWGSGRTRIETMQTLGLRPELVRSTTMEDGINACRRMLPLAVFHPRTEATGVAALEQYHRKYDEERKCFSPDAFRDWTTHAADAARYMALAWQTVPRVITVPKRQPGTWIIPPPADPHEYRGIRI